ncbi:MAG: FkbM family methyltransferase [Lachnospiraceae bacterium]|nr:FkbM family methyltransferase [Lachnospiraceae bacterium]
MEMQLYKQSRELADSVREALAEIIKGSLSGDETRTLLQDMSDAMFAVNQTLFGFPFVFENPDTQPADPQKRVLQLPDVEGWLRVIEDVLSRRGQAKNRFDELFLRVTDCAAHVPYQDMLENCKRLFHENPPDVQQKMTAYYQMFHYFWGTLDPETGDYGVMESRLKAFREHREDFIWLYDRLQDYRSRQVVIQYLQYWMSYDTTCIKIMRECCFDDYFDPDILPVSPDEVVVDLGGYNGDTIRDYVSMYGRYKRIYTFEVSPVNAEAIRQNTAGYPDIVIVNKAAGSERGTVKMQLANEASSTNAAIGSAGDESGSEQEVEVTTVDDEISEPVTMIKMDIEGAEKDALLGCKRHIIQEHPKLLICVYHNNEDIWKIARMIHEMDVSYRFYLRSNGNQWGPAEIVLFAL